MGGPGLPRGLYDGWRRVVTGMRGNLVGRPQQVGVAPRWGGGAGSVPHMIMWCSSGVWFEELRNTFAKFC